MPDLFFPEILPQPPALTSSSISWNSVGIEHHIQPPGETPEYCLDHHVLGILLKDSVRDEHWMAGEYFNALALFGTSQIDLAPQVSVYDPLIFQIALALLTQLQSQNDWDAMDGEIMANALATQLLKKFATLQKKQPSYTGGLSPCQLQQVTDYINDNLAQELSLQELAGVIQLSQHHFSRTFKQSVGLSPYQYVIQQRVERAKLHLKQGQKSLGEISVLCGFSHQSHLHRHFKRLTGVTPKAYRCAAT